MPMVIARIPAGRARWRRRVAEPEPEPPPTATLEVAETGQTSADGDVEVSVLIEVSGTPDLTDAWWSEEPTGQTGPLAATQTVSVVLPPDSTTEIVITATRGQDGPPIGEWANNPATIVVTTMAG